MKPLLDALADDKESQQKIAIEVLAYVENKSAGPALYNYATGTADKSLRVRAMIACGALRDPALLGRYEQMLAPREGAASVLPSDAIAVAAAWGVARMGDRKAEGLLVKLLASSSPDVRALAAVGLGLTHDKKHVPALATLARASEASATARAAADARAGRAGGRGGPGAPPRQRRVGRRAPPPGGAPGDGAAREPRRRRQDHRAGRGHRGGGLLRRRVAAPDRGARRRRAGGPTPTAAATRPSPSPTVRSPCATSWPA